MNLLPEYALSRLDTVHHCSAETLLNALPSDSIDMAITSPPYDQLRTYNMFDWNFEAIAHQTYRVLKAGAVLVWVVGDATIDGSETLTSFRQALYFRDVAGFRMHDTMIYKKAGVVYPEINRYYPQFEYMFVFSKGRPNTTNLQTQRNRYAGTSNYGDLTTREVDGSLTNKGKRTIKEFGVMGNVWEFVTGFGNSSRDKEAFLHPAAFPEKLAERHILTWSNPGDVVLDFFMGSGTAAKMARRHNRRYMGCDVSQEYVTLARKRLEIPYAVDMFALAHAEAVNA